MGAKLTPGNYKPVNKRIGEAKRRRGRFGGIIAFLSKDNKIFNHLLMEKVRNLVAKLTPGNYRRGNKRIREVKCRGASE